MKTPREAFKENFWIGAKGGLLDAKHYRQMGESVWLFLYLLLNQTGLNQAGEGVANYGHPLTCEEISRDFKGVHASTIRKWAARLRCEGYIRTEAHGPRGIVFWIAKAKAKTRKVKITTEEAQSMLAAAEKLRQESRTYKDRTAKESRTDQHAFLPESHTDKGGEPTEETLQPVTGARVEADFEPPTPKGFTSENLSYYNKYARAENASFSLPSFKKVLKEKTIPKTMSPSEVVARRRKLLLQAEEIMRKHPPKAQPGKVLEMQPQEATA